jgi:hypothetical protein
MHNMIIEDEGKLVENTNYEDVGVIATPYRTITQDRVEYINKHHKLKNTAMHSQLQMDLIEHQWMRHAWFILIWVWSHEHCHPAIYGVMNIVIMLCMES